MDEVIQVGCIVSLGSDKYKVYKVRNYQGKIVPCQIKRINSAGKEGSLIKDSYGSWGAYGWEFVSPPAKPMSKEQLIINKIKYLDEKFQKRKKEKESSSSSEVTINVHDAVYTTSTANVPSTLSSGVYLNYVWSTISV